MKLLTPAIFTSKVKVNEFQYFCEQEAVEESQASDGEVFRPSFRHEADGVLNIEPGEKNQISHF